MEGASESQKNYNVLKFCVIKSRKSAAGLYEVQEQMYDNIHYNQILLGFFCALHKNTERMTQEHFMVRKIPHVEVVLLPVFAPPLKHRPEFSLTSLLLISCLNFKDHMMKEESGLNTLTRF